MLPFMARGSMRAILRRDFPSGLDEDVIASVALPVLQALEYVHRNGGIHRDVKAANILLSDTGDVQLADFGVAVASTRTASMVTAARGPSIAAAGGGRLGNLRATTVIGTLAYMAPEVMCNDGDGCVCRRGGRLLGCTFSMSELHGSA